MRANLNSVPTLSYTRLPASSAWTTASMLIGSFSPPKLVKSTAKRGSRGVFCPFPPPKMTKWAGAPWGYRKTSVNANATPKILLPKSSWGFGERKILSYMGVCHAKRANSVCDQMKLGYISVLVAHLSRSPQAYSRTPPLNNHLSQHDKQKIYIHERKSPWKHIFKIIRLG